MAGRAGPHRRDAKDGEIMTTETLEHWTLLGCGAVGGVLAGLLATHGQSVTLLDTRPQATGAALALDFIDLQGQEHPLNLPRLSLPQIPQLECLLVTTKAYQVIPALTPLIARLPARVPILLLHNGMGTESWVRQHFPINPLLVGITSNGALRTGAHQFRHTGPGETWIGAVTPQARAWRWLVERLAAALPHAAWSDDIHRQQWSKLVINAVINPLTALANIPNGKLLDHRQQVAALCRELMPLLARQGFTLPVEGWIEKVLAVARLTAGNYSSMHQDLVLGRPTEIDFVTGFLLREAQAAGLSLPAHQSLYDSIKHKENTHV